MDSSTSDRKKNSLSRSIFKFLGISTLAGTLVAGLLLPFSFFIGGGAALATNWLNQLPEEFDAELPQYTSRVLDKEGNIIASFYSQNRTIVTLDEMSPFIKDAIISIEDNRFYEHGGVDTFGVARALVSNFFSTGGRQGGSTITQQFVNNLIINRLDLKGRSEDVKLGEKKGYLDKLREIKLAISIEKGYSKDQILQGYLNLIFFNANAYGVEAASKFFFNATAKDLNLPQAALLAGMINNPTMYDPQRRPQDAKNRRDIVLNSMLKYGKITEEQYNKAIATPIELNITPSSQGCYSSSASYFCDYILNIVASDDQFGSTPQERIVRLQRGGYTIKTTLDPRLQKAADESVQATVPIGDPSDVGNTLVTVEPGKGNILAMAQNTKYTNSLDPGNTVLNFNVEKDMGGSGGFQPGSTFKPFTLLEWLKQGKTLNQQVNGSIRSYPPGYRWKAHCVPGGNVIQIEPYNFKNASEGYYRNMTVTETIANSINTSTFAMASQLDFCNIRDGAAELGVHRGDGGEIDVMNASFILGSDNVAPLNLAAAYATFASGGIYCTPIAIDSITDGTGKSYSVPQADCTRKLDSQLTAAVNGPLQEVLRRGSGWNIPLKYPAAAKTGTTDNSEATWTIGYTTGLATAIWVGSWKDFSSLNNRLINGSARPYVDGATIAGKQWQQYMNKIAGFYSTDNFPPVPPKYQGAVVRLPENSDKDKNSESKDTRREKPVPTRAPQQPAQPPVPPPVQPPVQQPTQPPVPPPVQPPVQQPEKKRA